MASTFFMQPLVLRRCALEGVEGASLAADDLTGVLFKADFFEVGVPWADFDCFDFGVDGHGDLGVAAFADSVAAIKNKTQK